MEYKFETLNVVRIGEHVLNVQLNRPKKGNAMNSTFWKEYRQCFEQIRMDSTCRVVVVTANGKYFSVGLDIKESGSLLQGEGESDVARKVYKLRQHVLDLQDAFTAMERCNQPVIGCVQGAAIGGAIDLLCACDIRLCSKQAWFNIKEVDIGLAADVGTLQRLHHVMGNMSLARELCYTARNMDAAEAKDVGFVSRVLDTNEELVNHAIEMAKTIATKSPVAIAGTKHHLNYSRENTVANSLQYMATWNGGLLQTEDVMKSAMASISKSGPPEFSKL